MSHNPDQLAAAYLDGLSTRERGRYEAHLLDCEPCWREVSLARRGRELAESIADPAPRGTRESIRAAVTAAAVQRDARGNGQHHRRLNLAAAVAVVILALAGGIAAWQPWRSGPGSTRAPGSTLAAAVASFRSDRLPGGAVPSEQPPNLSTIGLHLVGASRGSLGGTEMSAFAYRSEDGSRLNLYRSARPIPETEDAEHIDGAERAWQADVDGVMVICGPATHTDLLIGADTVLVQRAGSLLDIV